MAGLCIKFHCVVKVETTVIISALTQPAVARIVIANCFYDMSVLGSDFYG